MSRHRLFVDSPLTSDSVIRLGDQRAHYLTNVLRLRIGDPVDLFDGSGYEFAATVVESDKKTVSLKIGESVKPDTESSLNIWLIQAVVKGERMDYCVQKSTELGVHAIVPVLTARTVVKLKKDRAQKRQVHWQKIAISAAEQSGRVKVPVVYEPVSLQEFIDSNLPESAQLLFMNPEKKHERELEISAGSKTPLALFVGPEGGFDENEVDVFVRIGAAALNIGNRVLRSETAGLVGITVCQMNWGDFR